MADHETPLGAGTTDLVRRHEGLSGIHLLNDGRIAFAARVALVRTAARALDLQYYIWHGDLSGSLLLNEVHAAAERGVRVRMLLDDNGIAGLDVPLAAFAAHRNVEVRLFNPFKIRRPKLIGYALDFRRLNRRMHNKSLAADGAAAIVGGRNIGDEYFGARDDGLYADLDALAIGPVVEEVGRQFDRYWSSASAYPAELILPTVTAAHARDLSAAAKRAAQDPRAQAYMAAIARLPFVDELRAGKMRFTWAAVTMLSDDPSKALGRAPRGRTLNAELHRATGAPSLSLDVVSAYFVPTAEGVKTLGGLAQAGIGVRVLTNSYETNDVIVVHAGYAPRRKALLRAGVRLFELRRPKGGGKEARRKRILGSGSALSGSGGSGTALRASASTLHAKTFAIDGKRLFVGSFNFDPRSMHLNTELGFLIESAELASAASRRFDETVPEAAYEVVLTSRGRLNWIERTGSSEVRHTTEPGSTWMQRMTIQALSRLPIEWLL